MAGEALFVTFVEPSPAQWRELVGKIMDAVPHDVMQACGNERTCFHYCRRCQIEAVISDYYSELKAKRQAADEAQTRVQSAQSGSWPSPCWSPVAARRPK